MRDDDFDSTPLGEALAAVSFGQTYIIAELRRMAEARHPYEHLYSMSQHIKTVWLAAADLIEADLEEWQH